MPAMSIPLPDSTVRLIQSVPCRKRHPGLQLDKYIEPPQQQEQQKDALKSVLETLGDDLLLQALLRRRQAVLQRLGAATFTATTAAPLTLHLARASALENAGICLHPVYGFVYFPGSGLKGMARAFAETVWLPAQLGPDWRQATAAQWNEALDTLDGVFGFAAYIEPKKEERKQMSEFALALNDRRKQRAGQRKNSDQPKAAAGNIVFHDAWPLRWPKLQLDIVNNHHTEYYNNADAAPGDWENPVMVSFLAIGPGETFDFALAKRRSDVPDELLHLAKEWLMGALAHEGLGAKTAAGYGGFQIDAESVPMPKPPAREVFQTTLELVTPAFLAGPHQAAEDCDLRPATLRGLLRWWWRTMHAGYVDLPTLHRLEAAVWGATDSGGPVRITVRRDTNQTPSPVSVPGKSVEKDTKNRDVLRADQAFMQTMGLCKPPDQKTTQGLLYLSYGMDEMPAGRPEERKQRFIMPPGARWHVTLTAGSGLYRPPDAKSSAKAMHLPARIILQQAQAALWLLCHYGGVGSKGRNGFGSLAQVGGADEESHRAEIERIAAEFRQTCAVPEYCDGRPQIPALKDALSVVSIATRWKSYWFVLDQLGYSLQAFAQNYKRNWIKEALGLPRKIGVSAKDGSADRGYRREWDKKTSQQIVWLGQKHSYLGKREPKDMPHAAPVHFHIARKPDGTHVIRALAFPCSVLPDWHTSRKVLCDLLKHLESDLESRCQKHGEGPPPVPVQSVHAPAQMTAKRPAGTPARVTIQRPRPKGGYDVQEEGKPQGTLTVGTPPDLPPQVGETVEVEVHNDDPRRPQYRWPQAPPRKPGGPRRNPRR